MLVWQVRDECVVMNGEDNCKEAIEAHKVGECDLAMEPGAGSCLTLANLCSVSAAGLPSSGGVQRLKWIDDFTILTGIVGM